MYQGYFVLIVEHMDSPIAQTDLTSTYDGATYVSQRSEHALVYTLPVQVFPARAYGYLVVNAVFY